MKSLERQALLGLFDRFDEIEQIKEQVCPILYLRVLVSVSEFPDQHIGWHSRQIPQRKSESYFRRIFQILADGGLIARYEPDRGLKNGTYYELTKKGEKRIQMALRLMSANAQKETKKGGDEDARHTCSC